MSDNVLSVQPRPQDGLGLVPHLGSAPRPSGGLCICPAATPVPPSTRPCPRPTPAAPCTAPPPTQAPPLTGRSCAGPAPSGPGGRWSCCSCAAASGPRRGTGGRLRVAPCGSGGRGSRRHSPGSTRTGLHEDRGDWGGPDLRPRRHPPPPASNCHPAPQSAAPAPMGPWGCSAAPATCSAPSSASGPGI